MGIPFLFTGSFLSFRSGPSGGRFRRTGLRLVLGLAACGLFHLFCAVPVTRGAVIEDANRLWWNGDYEGAALRYAEIVRSSRSNVDAALELAALYRSVGDYGAAVRVYQKLLADADGDLQETVDVLLPLGESCYYGHRLDEAEDAFRRALAVEPRNTRVLFGLGRVLFEKEQLNEAESLLQSAAALEPSFPGTCIYLARVCEMRGETKRAIDYYRKAFGTDSQHAELLFPLGRAFMAAGSWEDAFRQYHRLRSMDRKNPLVLSRLEEIRPRLTRSEGEVVPAGKLESFKTVSAKPVPAGMPVLRIGLNTAAGGSAVLMQSFVFITNGPFVLGEASVSEGPAHFEGAPHTEYRIFMNKGKTFIDRNEPEKADPEAVPRIFSIVVRKTDDAGDRAAAVIVRSIEYARGYAWAGIEDRQYRGSLEVRTGAGGLKLINVISLEEYLYSVLPSEMSIGFPEEALKAQAVVARSYALHRKRVIRPHRNDGFDLCDSQHCQVYRGAANEWKRTTTAVENTRGEVLMSGGRIASPLFHANCGGHTQSSKDLAGWSEVSYLTGVLDGPPGTVFPMSPVSLERWLKTRPHTYCGAGPLDPGAEFRWFRLIPADLLGEKLDRLRGIGSIRSITVLSRNPAGYAHGVRVEGTRGEAVIDKEHEIRRLLGLGPLRSNLFWIETKLGENGLPEEFLLYGGGWGHGVGMCQQGSGGMAERGFSYDEILKHYYTNAELQTLDY